MEKSIDDSYETRFIERPIRNEIAMGEVYHSYRGF